MSFRRQSIPCDAPAPSQETMHIPVPSGGACTDESSLRCKVLAVALAEDISRAKSISRVTYEWRMSIMEGVYVYAETVAGPCMGQRSRGTPIRANSRRPESRLIKSFLG